MELKIEAKKRDVSSRNVYRKSIREGFIAGVMYNSKLNVPISVERRSFSKIFDTLKPNSVLDMVIDGKVQKAVVKSYTETAHRRFIEHVDFYALEPGVAVKVRVPVRLVGTSKGVVRGGVIQHFMHEIGVKAELEKIPDNFDIDITDMDFNDRVFVKDLKVPAGVKLLDSSEKVIVSVISSAKAEAKAAKAEAALMAGTTAAVAAAPAADAAAAPGAAAPAAGAAPGAAPAAAGAKAAAAPAAPAKKGGK